MAEPRGDLDLPEESLGADCTRKLRAKHLHRDVTAMPFVDPFENGAHPTVRNLELQAIPALESHVQAFEYVGHSDVRVSVVVDHAPTGGAPLAAPSFLPSGPGKHPTDVRGQLRWTLENGFSPGIEECLRFEGAPGNA